MWLAIGDEAENKMLNLCARGESDLSIAEMLVDEGHLDITAKDIAAYRKRNRESITSAAVAQARDIMLTATRSKQHFRVAELDAILNEIRQGFSALMEEGAFASAGKLADVYFRGTRLVAEEMGDLSGAPQGNEWITLMQDATPETRLLLVKQLNDLKQTLSGVTVKEIDIIDVEAVEVYNEDSE